VAASIRGWSSGSSAPRSTASISSRESSKCERIEGQLEAARTFAEARGWTVVREFKDTDVSGGEFVDRPGFNALMGAVQAKPRPFEVLVTRDLDRIGRDMFRTGSALQTIIEKKCRIFTYADGEEVRLGNFVEKAMAMRARLNELLTEDEDLHWQLITERTAQWGREQAQPLGVRENQEKEMARIEGEVARLVAAIAGGKESPAIVAEITKREAAIEALKAKLAAPVAFDVSREELREGMVTVRKFLGGSYRLIDDPSKDYMLVEDDKVVGPLASGHVAQVRALLRRLAIERVPVIRDGDHWRFEGTADLFGLVGSGKKGDLAAPPDGPPPGSLAGRATDRLRRQSRRSNRERRRSATTRPLPQLPVVETPR
jgi:hypothetical protein